MDALQEIRIKHRWEAIDDENDDIEYARSKSLKYTPELLQNGDTLKQLLARSRYLLYKGSIQKVVEYIKIFDLCV